MNDFENGPNKIGLKRALCYVPIMALVFFVIEKGNKDIENDIRYGMGLFFLFIILSIISKLLGVAMLVFILYIFGSAYLGFLAFNNEKIKISFLDDIFEAMFSKKK